MNCACGLPLHYSDPEAKAFIDALVDKKGDTIIVRHNGLAYRVQRHYVALHGLKAWELETLADQGIVQRWEESKP